jgi:hypothetical protein
MRRIVMKDTPSLRRLRRLTGGLLGLSLAVAGAVHAQTAYQIQPIVKRGDRVGDLILGRRFELGALDDDGRLFLAAESDPGREMLLQVAPGRIIPIVTAGGEAPSGKWPADVEIATSANASQGGDVVFSVKGERRSGGDASDGYGPYGGSSFSYGPARDWLGLFVWDARAQKVVPVLRPERAAGIQSAFPSGGTALINNHNEIVFQGGSYSPKSVTWSTFFLGRDGTLRRVAQALPRRGKIERIVEPSLPQGMALSDDGKVVFAARDFWESRWGTHVWAHDRIVPRTQIVPRLSDGQTLRYVSGIWANTRNRNLLVAGGVDQTYSGSRGLYRFAGGKLTPVALERRPMPGGGALKRLGQVTPANRLGQHVLLAELEDGSQAAYRVDADGTLALILREGASTGALPAEGTGPITQLGTWFDPQSGVHGGVSLNDRGQVALHVRIAGGPETIVLLTPAAGTSRQTAEPASALPRSQPRLKPAPAVAASEPAAKPIPAPQVSEPDVNAASLDRLRQLGEAISRYLQDHDEQMPPLKDVATMRKALLPYVKDGSVLVHPGTHEPYRPNPALSRVSLASIAVPFKTVLLYEARPAADGTRGVLFSDGHASRVPEAEWPQLKRGSKLP